MKEYEINIETMALLPVSDNKVKVIELDEELLLSSNTYTIMDNSCRYFGSSLEGRRKGTETMVGINYKAPIIVEETTEMIFFPLSSLKDKNAAWICLKYVDKFYKDDQDVILEFLNGKKVRLNTSFRVLNNQVLRATRLESALRGRKTYKKRLNVDKIQY